MSDFTGIILSNALAQRREREASQRNLNQQIAMQMLQSLVTGLKGARTPKEAGKTFDLFNKQFSKLSGGIELFNRNDIENVQRLIEQEGTVTSRLARVTAEQVGGILTGKKNFADAMSGLNAEIDSLTQQFGEAEVNPFTAGTYEALANALTRRKAMESGEDQLVAALRPRTQAMMNFLPDLSGTIMKFEQGLDGLAMTALYQSEFGAGAQVDQGTLQSHWQQTGAMWYGMATDRASTVNLNADQKMRAVEKGYALWQEKLNNYKADLSDEFYDQILPKYVAIGEEQFESLARLDVQIANEALGRNVFGMVDLDFGPLLERVQQLQDKFERGRPTEMDEQRVFRNVDAVRYSGLLDSSGISFSKMSDENFEQALRDGTVEGALKRVRGPKGETLWSLMFDENGLARPYIDSLMMLDHEKLAKGDYVAWDLARALVTDPNPGSYQVTDPKTGKKMSIWGALFQSEEKDSQSIAGRAKSEALAEYLGTPTELMFGGVPGEVRTFSQIEATAEAVSRQRVETAVNEMDKATLEAIRTGGTSEIDAVMKDLFRAPQPNQARREEEIADIVDAFSAGFRRDQTIEERISTLRDSILKSTTIPLFEKKEETSGGEAGGEVVKKLGEGDRAREERARRIRETAALGETPTRISDIRLVPGGVQPIQIGPIGPAGPIRTPSPGGVP